MPIRNSDIAEIFNRIADLLDLQSANPFRIRAYRNAARTISSLSRSAADMVQQHEDLTKLPGIGQDLAGKIEEIVKTGSLAHLQELESQVPPGLTTLMTIPDLGPKRAMMLHKRLGINSREDLEELARKGEIRKLPGFGEKTERKILEALKRQRDSGSEGRVKLVVVEEMTRPLLDYLRQVKGVQEIEVAGSYRRKRETIGDLDILVTCRKDSPIIDRFLGYEDVARVISKGGTRSSVALRSGFQVDLRVLPQASYGAALHYFTGSKAHSIAVRKLAQKKGLKINEYGVFKGQKRIAGKSEEEVYKAVGLPYIEPELREDRGEVEAALKNRLPQLITLEEIRGDLQSHTTATDGKFSLEEMAQAARERHYEYLAITDHSRRVTMAKGLDAKRLTKQIREIERLNGKWKDFKILKSSELEILEDGSLDLPDDILKELDLVVGAVHYHFHLSREKQTQRIIRAMDHPYFNILAHPTGRRIGKRHPYEVDLELVMKAAKERGCFLELNAQPERLDLPDVYVKMAKDMGLQLAISTDAHRITDLDYMRLGVSQARRGWMEAGDVLNTRSWNELSQLLKRN